jgi:hypothetical protein
MSNFVNVKCCDRNKDHIYWSTKDDRFYIDCFDMVYTKDDEDYEPIEYCPWCGVLLDTNLLES